MNPNYCVSLEMAKKLKEVGWKKNTEFLWKRHSLSGNFTDPREYEYKIMHLEGFSISKNDNIYPAPLAAEILEELQNYLITIETDIENYRVIFDGDSYEEFNDESLCDALAKMWIYLKNKVIKSDL